MAGRAQRMELTLSNVLRRYVTTISSHGARRFLPDAAFLDGDFRRPFTAEEQRP